MAPRRTITRHCMAGSSLETIAETVIVLSVSW